ncbi:MAG: hypothetical protein HY900_10385 [Deltaproteobacteria bacterium]|nr:hypothetical protein [Deltaproteobacteria bacterium]
MGTPYFVDGTSHLVEVPILYFIKFVLGMGEAGGQLFDSLRGLGWLAKPAWGYLTDRIAIAGYHRKSWYVLMALLAIAFWILNAALVAAGFRNAPLFLLTFNLAFGTYSFVDVVCDALMVTEGRKRRVVGAFVNFQWTVFSIAAAGAALAGGWLEQRVQSGSISLSWIFLIAALPPLATAIVGILCIDEEKQRRNTPARARGPRDSRAASRGRGGAGGGSSLSKLGSWLSEHRTLCLLALFLFFWKFSPSIGYIERSYLIDVRDFKPATFGVLLSAERLTFLVSIFAYRWFVARVPAVQWYQYLYAMVAIGAVSFPVTFLLYLDPGHPWWDAVFLFVPEGWDPIPGWNRYEWARLVFQVVLGFATIAAFMIPLTLAGETVSVPHAGMNYAFLTALANATDTLEGTLGAGLYGLVTGRRLGWVLDAFHGSALDIAGVADKRTLALQLFIYLGLAFTLLTVPFVHLLRRELARRGISIDLAGRAPPPEK